MWQGFLFPCEGTAAERGTSPFGSKGTQGAFNHDPTASPSDRRGLCPKSRSLPFGRLRLPIGPGHLLRRRTYRSYELSRTSIAGAIALPEPPPKRPSRPYRPRCAPDLPLCVPFASLVRNKGAWPPRPAQSPEQGNFRGASPVRKRKPLRQVAEGFP